MSRPGKPQYRRGCLSFVQAVSCACLADASSSSKNCSLGDWRSSGVVPHRDSLCWWCYRLHKQWDHLTQSSEPALKTCLTSWSHRWPSLDRFTAGVDPSLVVLAGSAGATRLLGARFKVVWVSISVFGFVVIAVFEGTLRIELRAGSAGRVWCVLGNPSLCGFESVSAERSPSA